MNTNFKTHTSENRARVDLLVFRFWFSLRPLSSVFPLHPHYRLFTPVEFQLVVGLLFLNLSTSANLWGEGLSSAILCGSRF
jgi:hypothetical protein